jgi:hypothetical protein
MFRRFYELFLLLLLTSLGPAQILPTEYWSDHFVLLASDETGAPLLITMDFNRGTSDVPGREKVAEFVGQFCLGGSWYDLQSGEYPYPGGRMGRLVGNGICRPRKNRDDGWTIDYDGHRTSFFLKTEEEVLLHVQRDDPELTTRHSAMNGFLEFNQKRYPMTLFREEIRWRGYNRFVNRTPKRMYGNFDWMPLVSGRGDWWLLIQDPGQARVPDDAPDHNWGVYRSPQGVIRPIPADEFRLYAIPGGKQRKFLPAYRRRTDPAHELVPRGWSLHLPSLKMRGEVRDRGHMLDRFRSGLFAVQGAMYLPGAGKRNVVGLVDHIER